MRTRLFIGGLIVASALVATATPVRADIGRLGENRAWMVSANLGVGGLELDEGTLVMSGHYVVYRAVRPHIVLGGRAGLFVEPGLIGDADRDASVFDVGPLVGLTHGSGRITAVASAGPMLTFARKHTDLLGDESPAELEMTGGLALDGGASFGLAGPVGLGLHASANLNPEVVVVTAGISLDITFGS
jgi:hypothetical protein